MTSSDHHSENYLSEEKDSEEHASKNSAADSLVAVLAVIIPVLAIIFWLSGLPVS